MKKSSKRFQISTKAKNTHGFHVLPEGIDLTEYRNNPIMLWMHRRPKGESRTEILPLGFWEDFEVRDGKLTAVPSFDDTDDFAMSIYNKVENGTLRMASAGLKPGADAWEIREDVPWLVQSSMVEISLVDIGSDPEAFAIVLYDENDNMIQLSTELIQSIAQPKLNYMKLIQLSAPDVLPVLGLEEGAKPEEVQAKINEVVQLAATQKTLITDLETKRQEAEDKLAEQINLANEAKVVTMVDAAVAARKITEGDKEQYVKLAKADFDTTKSILDGMKVSPAVKDQVQEGKTDEAGELLKLSWGDMDKSGKLPYLKLNHPEVFKAKYKEKFGKEPKMD